MISLILSGGVGSRLWPLSREKLPKQFSPIMEESLFINTVRRLSTIGEVQVCTSDNLRDLTEAAIRKSGLDVSEIFYEPVGRNTAPAIALVCSSLLKQGREGEVVGVYPSDHWIDNPAEFQKTIRLAEQCAREGQIVTIGIKPSHPATGFGYIDCDENIFKQEGALKAFNVKGFKEKPELDVAQKYLEAGHYFWNSGMFVFKVETMIDCFKQWMPEMWSSMLGLEKDLSNLSEIYLNLESQSIDYGVMEKSQNQVNIPCDIGWNDLGSWDDIAEIYKAKEIRPEIDIVSVQSQNCFGFGADKKTLCFLGVEDLIVVDTDDALLVTKKAKSQNVKELVSKLREKHQALLTDHQFENRPWGYYKNLHEEENFKTKVITVDPGQQLSYQSHQKRAEVWVTVQGEGEVVLEDKIIPVQSGVVVTIPVGAKHRMRNTGDKVLKFVEVQLGTYFGEDDIKRFKDDYKRV